MAGLVTHWERRDGADREALGKAAFDLCRATRQRDGIRSSRYFWTGPDQIAMLTEADTMADFEQPAKPDQAMAIFALADLARETSVERWIDPRAGMEAYNVAGR